MATGNCITMRLGPHFCVFCHSPAAAVLFGMSRREKQPNVGGETAGRGRGGGRKGSSVINSDAAIMYLN